MKDYHRKILPIIKEMVWSKKHLELCTKKRPLKINHPIKNFSMHYYPDVYFLNKNNNKYCIFEILDTQPNTKTIADIFRIMLYRKCYLALFIVKSEEIKINVELIVDTFKLILSDIITKHDKSIKLRKKELLNLHCITIEYKIINNPNSVKRIIIPYIFKKKLKASHSN